MIVVADYLYRRTARYVRKIEELTKIDDIYSISLRKDKAGLFVVDYTQQSKGCLDKQVLDESRKYITYLKKRYPTIAGFFILVCDEVAAESYVDTSSNIGPILVISNLNKELK